MANKTVKYTFNATGGKAIGTHRLGTLPGGAVIRQAYIDVETTCTSATDAATIALGYTGATGAFDAAVAISDGSNPWDAGVPRVSVGAADGAVGNYIVVSSNVDVVAVVAVEALTAGVVELVIEYEI